MIVGVLGPAFAITSLDEIVSNALTFNPVSHQFLGTGAGDWWANILIHEVGGLGVRIIAALVLLAWGLSFLVTKWHAWRRPAGFLVLALTLSVGGVNFIKIKSNVDCPRDLVEFGGDRPYIRLFAHRPDELPLARCFPGGHSSSGFALFAFYFLFLGVRPRLARVFFFSALLVGGVFAFGQEARGAHFLSHDLWSLAMVWFSCLAVYTLGYGGQVWSAGKNEGKTAQGVGLTH